VRGEGAARPRHSEHAEASQADKAFVADSPRPAAEAVAAVLKAQLDRDQLELG